MNFCRSGALFGFLLLLTGPIILAQTIMGSVVDNETNEPLPFVNVFISNTTKGTQTDAKGNFVLKPQSAGYSKVVASMVGYKTFEQEFILRPDETRRLTIHLTTDTRFLTEVKIAGKLDKQWKRLYNDFEREFLGRNKNARNCKVINPYDIDVTKKRQVLTARATKTIEIENNALGYSLSYQLEDFQSTKVSYQFSGRLFFKLLPTTDDAVAKTWENNRNQAYRGSLRHFLASVVHKKSREEGFRVYLEQTPSTQLVRNHYFRNNSLIEINADTLAQFNASLQRASLPNHRYEIHYIHRNDPQTWYFDVNREVSWLNIKGAALDFSYNGILENSKQLETVGSMSKRRVADLLPDDYQSTGTLPNEPFEDTGLIPNYKKQEKINLTTDQNAYIPGDTLRFEIEVVDATSHAPIDQAIIYLTIRNQERWIDQQKLWLERGKYRGKWVIPDTLKGTYQLIVHNRWARNFDEHFWGRKNIQVFADSLPEDPRQDSLHVRFFPESGHLLSGVSNHVGFSSFTKKGYPKALTGWLLNAKGDTVSTFTSNAQGYGDFYLIPDAAQTLKVVFEDKSEQVFPAALAKGYLIQAEALKDSASINIRLINNLSPSEWKPMRLLIHLRGQILYEAIVTPKRNITFIKIPRENLEGTGVMQLLLLDALNQPITTRAFYQPSAETTEEESNESNARRFEAELYACPLDSSLLKNDLNTLRYLDLLLLTHMIRPYDSPPSTEFEYESGISVRGSIRQVGGKPLAAIPLVGFVNSDSTQVGFETKTNDAGRFSSPPLLFFGKTDLVIQLQSDKAKNAVILLDTLPDFIPKWLWMPTAVIAEDQKRKLSERWHHQKQVSSVATSANRAPQHDPRRNYTVTDKTIVVDERSMKGFALPLILELTMKKITLDNTGAYFTEMGNSKSNGKHAALLIDGLSTDWESLKTLYGLEIEAIDFITDPFVLSRLGPATKNGVINVLLKPGSTFLADQHIQRFKTEGLRP